MRGVLGLVLAAVLGAGSAAWGTTQDGALLTNWAMATYSGGGPVGFQVSYNGTAWVLVDNPKIRMLKTGTPTLQAPGGEVTFRVWVVNQSAVASAFAVTVVDRLPLNMEYVGASFGNWAGAGAGTGTWSPYHSAAGWGGPWTAGQPADGQDEPYYLRWVLTWLGPGRSGFVDFKARIL